MSNMAENQPISSETSFKRDITPSLKGLALPVEDETEMRNRMATAGVKGLEDLLKEKQSEWKNMHINIGVVGLSGAGKSSFINTIRGVGPRDVEAAPTGVMQVTVDPMQYPHPDNKNLVLWDLPGVGTQDYPQETYLKKIYFESYDFFLILSSVRFREEDAWLGREIISRGKRFFYVRTKVDIDLDNEKYDYEDEFNETEVLQRIRDDMTENLGKYPDRPIFLINNHDCKSLDFDVLTQRLVNDFPEIKRDVMILTLTTISSNVIKQKVEVLKKRIWKAALLAAGASAVPIPGPGIAVNIGVLCHEVVFYYKRLGLTHEALSRSAALTGSDVKKLKQIVDNSFPLAVLTTEGITEMLTQNAAMAAGFISEEVAKFVPFIGSAIDAALSFSAVCYVLSSSLKKMQDAALKVAEASLNEGIRLADV